MTPKQKAQKLWWDYYSAIEHTLSEEYSPHESAIAKQFALIAVDEILEVARDAYHEEVLAIHMIYWDKVKQEIEDL